MNKKNNRIERVDIPNYEGIYYCTRSGDIVRYAYKRSRENNGAGGVFKEKIIKGNKSGKYKSVALCKNGISKTFRVHVIVALCFHGVRPKGFVIDHIDRCSENNCADNLRYIPQFYNIRNTERYEKSVGYTYFYGKYRVRCSVGERINITKTTEEEAIKLVSEIKQGIYSIKELKLMCIKPNKGKDGRFICHH